MSILTQPHFAEKDRLFEVKAVLLFWGFICVNLRDLRETLGFLLSTLACYSPADGAEDADEYSRAVLSRRERQVVVCLVLWLVCEISVRLIGVSFE